MWKERKPLPYLAFYSFSRRDFRKKTRGKFVERGKRDNTLFRAKKMKWKTRKNSAVQKYNLCWKLWRCEENFAEKLHISCGIMRNKHIFPRISTPQKTAKTLTGTGFFEFFTKFSTTCGKLFLQVGNHIHFFLLGKTSCLTPLNHQATLSFCELDDSRYIT